MIACPSCTLARSVLCNLFVVTTMFSSIAAICDFKLLTALLSASTSLILASYSFACVLIRS